MTIVGKTGPKKDGAQVVAPPALALPVKENDRDETVPDSHPIAATIPEQFTIPIALRRIGLEIRESFEREEKLGPLVRRRTLRATYETWSGDLRDSRAEIVIDGEIRGFEFAPDGTPSDVKKWGVLVLDMMTRARQQAAERVAELITAGVDGEEAAASE